MLTAEQIELLRLKLIELHGDDAEPIDELCDMAERLREAMAKGPVGEVGTFATEVRWHNWLPEGTKLYAIADQSQGERT